LSLGSLISGARSLSHEAELAQAELPASTPALRRLLRLPANLLPTRGIRDRPAHHDSITAVQRALSSSSSVSRVWSDCRLGRASCVAPRHTAPVLIT